MLIWRWQKQEGEISPQPRERSWLGDVTLGDQLDKFKGIGPGFDHMRIGLAVAILAWHSFGASYGTEWVKTAPGFILATLATLLPMFFGLSGFLIMGSAFRTHDVRIFITFRVLRILPALAVEIALSAIVLGAFVTTLPVWDYYTNPQFFSYFGSLVGAIKYWLPGVFVDNPVNVVNGALWTVGPEIACYCLVAAMMLTGVFTRKGPMVLCAAAFVAICLFADRWETDWNVVHLPTKALVCSFMSGNLIYLYRYQIRYSWILFVVALVVSTAAIVAGNNYPLLRPAYYVAAFLMPYCCVMIGLTGLKPMAFFHTGDYSYGIYIYAFPIQQTIAYYFPDLRVWWFNLGLSLPLAIAFAFMSWHLIEKPALSLRKRILPNPGSLPSHVKRDGFTGGKLIALALIVAYGIFVTNASRVFPFKDIYYSLIGHASSKSESNIQQF